MSANRSASDPAQVKEAKKAAELIRFNHDADVLAIMGSEAGRRFVWRFLGMASVYKSIFTTSSEIYYKAGWQDCGHWLQAEVARVAPNEYLLMQQEAAKLTDAITPDPKDTTDV